MKKSNQSFLSLFDPPNENLTGLVGFLSSYSSTSDFLEQALERFAKKGLDSIGSKGDFHIAIAIDKGKSQIAHIPGIYQMIRKPNGGKFDLLHAKVGILTFAKSKYSEIDHIRCFVLTGNLTRGGTRDNLDLVWVLDLDLNKSKIELSDKADVFKIFKFFTDLQEYYTLPKETKNKYNILLDKINSWNLSSKDLESSRFISNLGSTTSIFNLINIYYQNLKVPTKHNILICGSGFYENQKDEFDKLDVFENIEKELCAADCFVKSKPIEGYIVINHPKDTGKFKSINFDLKRIKWAVHKSKDLSDVPQEQERKFHHAKYIFSGHLRNGNFSNSVLYLGSANLTKKGMLYPLTNPMSNVEAGVIINIESINDDELYTKLSMSNEEISQDEIIKSEFTIDEIENTESLLAPPIIALKEVKNEFNKYKIEWIESNINCFIVDKSNNLIEVKREEKIVNIELSKYTPMVKIFWNDNQNSCFIPIFTSNGTFCQTPPGPLSTEEAIFKLLAFPDDEVITNELFDDEDDIGFSDNNLSNRAEDLPSKKRYISLAVELVENISRKNQLITTDNILSWIENLEYVLCECVTNEEINNMAKAEVNIFEILKSQYFSPNWDTIVNQDIIKKYNSTIDRIIKRWRMENYPIIGEVK